MIRFFLSSAMMPKDHLLDTERVVQQMMHNERACSGAHPLNDALPWARSNLKCQIEIEDVTHEYGGSLNANYSALNLWITLPERDAVLFRLYHSSFMTENEVRELKERNARLPVEEWA